MKIAYLGFDVLYPCLTALETSGCTVMEIFTCNTDNIYEFNIKMTEFAGQRKIPCHIHRITLQDIHRLKKSGCQALFCAGYYHKVPIDYSLPVVNVHPSLLPVGRGAWPMPVTILRGLDKSGVTLHKMENDFDSGDILLQQAFPVTADDNLETMTEKICEISAELCTRLMKNFDFYWNNAVVQGNYEYWDCPQKKDFTVTAETAPDQTQRILRAFYGFDCYLQISDDSEICIERGKFLPVQHNLPFGTQTVSADGQTAYAVSGGIIAVPD